MFRGRTWQGLRAHSCLHSRAPGNRQSPAALQPNMVANRFLNQEMTQPNPAGITVASGPRLKAALALAVLADVLQMVVFPIFIEGAASPAEDILDLGMAAVLTWLLGWHWEFLPSFAAKLLPGVDLIPLWSLSVANVYRKSRHFAAVDPKPLKSANPLP